jgi:hypothetical protein
MPFNSPETVNFDLFAAVEVRFGVATQVVMPPLAGREGAVPGLRLFVIEADRNVESVLR